MVSEKPTITSVGGLFVDDRGALSFFNDFDPSILGIRRFYQVHHAETGFIRAWHFHHHEEKYVYVPYGTFLVGVVDPQTNEVFKFVLSSKQPKLLWIPSGYANGFKNLEPNSGIVFFSTSTTEQSKDDDIRYPWDKWNIWKEDYR